MIATEQQVEVGVAVIAFLLASLLLRRDNKPLVHMYIVNSDDEEDMMTRAMYFCANQRREVYRIRYSKRRSLFSGTIRWGAKIYYSIAIKTVSYEENRD